MVHLTVILTLIAKLKSPPILFQEDTAGISYGNPWLIRKLNACQSVFVNKSPNLMSSECTTPMVRTYACTLVKFIKHTYTKHLMINIKTLNC